MLLALDNSITTRMTIKRLDVKLKIKIHGLLVEKSMQGISLRVMSNSLGHGVNHDILLLGVNACVDGGGAVVKTGSRKLRSSKYVSVDPAA